ncbi:hypothetical protein FBQ82_11605 [Anaerolineae bacterium CFX7]|nr:hypothetical protein [Anaerolineae bacterium CFX7]
MPFPSRTEYEALVYGITTEFSDVIVSSTLRIYSTAALSSNVEGQVDFANGLILEVWEVIDFRNERFVDYSYDVSYQGEKIRYYDPQPHPEIESLQATFPHHQHNPPNIKQNRQPAPGISFDTPNLHTLIRDCVALGESLRQATE